MNIGLRLQQLFPSFLFASTVFVLVAAPAFAQGIQVTGVRVSATLSGVNVILKTNSDTIPQVSTTSLNKTLLTNIFNTQLLLPDGQAFRQDNPVERISSVTMTQQYPNTIRAGDLQGLGFGIGFNYVGEQFGDLQNSFEADSYFLTNADVFYQRNNWRVGLNFNNLFNVDYVNSAATALRTSGIEPGRPFTVIGSIEFTRNSDGIAAKLRESCARLG